LCVFWVIEPLPPLLPSTVTMLSPFTLAMMQWCWCGWSTYPISPGCGSEVGLSMD